MIDKGPASEITAKILCLRAVASGTAIVLVLTGCGGSSSPKNPAAHEPGSIVGELYGEFLHGSAPFYGSVVCLIPANATTEEWWIGLSNKSSALLDPRNDERLGYEARVLCDEQGRFRFERVRPGQYYVYDLVLWTMHGRTSAYESTEFAGAAWAGAVTVTARETVHVTLKSPRHLFGDSVRTRRYTRQENPPRVPLSDPLLPKYGQQIYVDELAEAVMRTTPRYPDEALNTGLSGQVVVAALVDSNGRVVDTRVVKSVPIFDHAAESTVRRWVFRPATKGKRPVATWVAVPLRFSPPPAAR